MLKTISKFAVVIATAFGLAFTGLTPAGASEGKHAATSQQAVVLQQTPSLQQFIVPAGPDAAEPQDVTE